MTIFPSKMFLGREGGARRLGTQARLGFIFVFVAIRGQIGDGDDIESRLFHAQDFRQQDLHPM